MKIFGVYNNEIRICLLNSNPTHCSIIQKSNLIFENLHDFIDIEKSNLIFENLHDFIDFYCKINDVLRCVYKVVYELQIRMITS